MHKAETSLGTGTLNRGRGNVEIEVFNNAVSRALFLGVTGSRVNARTLAESVAVANSGVPALQLDRAVFAVLGVTIANGSDKVTAECRNVRAELNAPALESSGNSKIIFSCKFTNGIDNFKRVRDAGLVIKVSSLDNLN